MHTSFSLVLVLTFCQVVFCDVGRDPPVEIVWLEFSGSVGSSSLHFFKEFVGREANSSGYINSTLCQGFHDGNWIPGKHIGDTCFVSRLHLEYGLLRFRVAQVEPYEVSWIPLPETGRTLPSMAIIGGQNIFGDDAYICRAFVSEDGNVSVIPGAYSAENHKCWFPKNGEEIGWSGDTEILAFNALGVAWKFSRG